MPEHKVRYLHLAPFKTGEVSQYGSEYRDCRTARLSFLAMMVFLLLFEGAHGQSFAEVAAQHGITSTYGLALYEGGGGVSFADFNDDGWDDLTFCNQLGDTLEFYANQNGLFSKVDPPFVTVTCESKQAIWVDYDNDGDKDLFVTCYQDSNRLFRNTDMVFTEVTSAAGIFQVKDPTYGADFGDYDKDGDLDLYLSNYGFYTGTSGDLLGVPNVMYLNNGDGTFTDVTTFTGTENDSMQTFCSVFFDYDNDTWLDMYVINDRLVYTNTLYRNERDGTFSDVSDTSGTDIAIFAMNGGVGDYDNNGYQDIYVTNIQPSACLKNNGDGTFTDEAPVNGTIFAPRVGWGANFFDFDNDLDLDLYVCSMTPVFQEPNAMYVNDGTGQFTEPHFMTGGLMGTDTVQSHSSAIGDFNRDGLPDIAVNNAIVHPHNLWMNQTATTNNWFKLDLTGTKSNTDGIGSWIEVWIGGQKYIRTTHVSNGYLNQNSNTLIFGTGSNTSIDSLVVRWPVPDSREVYPGSAILFSRVNEITELCSINKTVFKNTGDGYGSFPRVMACAEEGDTVRFDSSLAGDTIFISNGSVTMDRDLVLMSAATPPVTLMFKTPGVFEIPESSQVEFHHVDIVGGPSGLPTAFDNAGVLALFDVTVRQHPEAPSGSLLIRNNGDMYVRNSNILEQ